MKKLAGGFLTGVLALAAIGGAYAQNASGSADFDGQGSGFSIANIVSRSRAAAQKVIFPIIKPIVKQTMQAPTGKGIGTMSNHHLLGQSDSSGASNGIDYHGGPLILGGVDVYYIWYGDWAKNSATSILTNLAQNIGGSPYFNINTSYYDASGAPVTNAVAYKGSTTDHFSHGMSLSDTDISDIVNSALAKGSLPLDSHGVYFVLTSSGVQETSGFCSQYCGWHNNATLQGMDVKYAFIGDTDQCSDACEPQTVSPNGNAAADGMASVISHELEEATTDPDLNAWYSQQGGENADMCAWNFGAEQAGSNGAKSNMTLGGLKYLIQQNWVNAGGGYCALSYSKSTPGSLAAN
ncbi:MAG: hypothetical protein ACYCPQ_08695 [Elusimicrobiota bacterium]